MRLPTLALRTLPGFLGVALLLAGCATQTDSPADTYVGVPETVIPQGRPLYLARKYLREDNVTAFKTVLSSTSKQDFEQQMNANPDYFNRLRSQLLDNEPVDRNYQYFTLNQWENFINEEDPTLRQFQERLQSNEVLVVAYAEHQGEQVKRVDIVVQENGRWKLNNSFAPLQ